MLSLLVLARPVSRWGTGLSTTLGLRISRYMTSLMEWEEHGGQTPTLADKAIKDFASVPTYSRILVVVT